MLLLLTLLAIGQPALVIEGRELPIGRDPGPANQTKEWKQEKGSQLPHSRVARAPPTPRQVCQAATRATSDQPSMRCFFPFIYKGVMYRTCTKDHSDNGEQWCATSVTRDGEVLDGDWGDCDPDTINCRIEETVLVIQGPENQEKKTADAVLAIQGPENQERQAAVAVLTPTTTTETNVEPELVRCLIRLTATGFGPRYDGEYKMAEQSINNRPTYMSSSPDLGTCISYHELYHHWWLHADCKNLGQNFGRAWLDSGALCPQDCDSSDVCQHWRLAGADTLISGALMTSAGAEMQETSSTTQQPSTLTSSTTESQSDYAQLFPPISESQGDYFQFPPPKSESPESQGDYFQFLPPKSDQQGDYWVS